MPNEYNKILKYNHGEKPLKTPAIFKSVCLKKYTHVKIILKNLVQRKIKLSMHLLVIHCLQIVHLIQQKISLIVTEGKTVSKGFVKT